ncbi:MAG: ribonuclease P protein component [Epsilonproteobacteria bacterium]|nr:ribonuclease P protein component [Campylobacterota bacterium]
MVKFTNCFRFSGKEIKQAFDRATFHRKLSGIKILKVCISPSSSSQHGKILIVASKSCGKAHQRNLFKRRIKAIYYQNKLYQNSTQWILIASAHALTLSFPELEQAILALLTATQE